MFGKKDVGLLPKDILVDLESDPKRADKMLEKFVKGEPATMDFSGQTFITATAASFPMPSDLERALRDMNSFNQRQLQLQQMAAMQNQGIGGQNGLNQSIGNALGGLGGLLGPQR